jgi:hypothetical protein
MSVIGTTLLNLPVISTGTESGTWGNYVNNGLTYYLDNAIAGTVTLTNDGAVTLSNTAGDNSATNIVSSLTGAGTVSAQFAIIRVTGTLTTAKVLTAPSSSREFIVVNAATGSTVTIKASGQSGVSVAVGETATVYFNGTDYVKSASNVLTSFTGVLPIANGGTNASTASITSFNNITGYTASGATGTTSTNLVFSTSPTLVTPVLGTPTSGTLSNCTQDGTTTVGFLSIPQNSQSTAYTTVLADSGKCIYHPTTDANARTFTIAANSSVAYPIGTVIQFVNMTAQVVTIAITTDTMYLAGTGTTGSRSLAQYGVANAMKMTSTTWIITGSGLT